MPDGAEVTADGGAACKGTGLFVFSTGKRRRPRHHELIRAHPFHRVSTFRSVATAT
jgi:hypothetical protein